MGVFKDKQRQTEICDAVLNQSRRWGWGGGRGAEMMPRFQSQRDQTCVREHRSLLDLPKGLTQAWRCLHVSNEGVGEASKDSHMKLQPKKIMIPTRSDNYVAQEITVELVVQPLKTTKEVLKLLGSCFFSLIF